MDLRAVVSLWRAAWLPVFLGSMRGGNPRSSAGSRSASTSSSRRQGHARIAEAAAGVEAAGPAGTGVAQIPGVASGVEGCGGGAEGTREHPYIWEEVAELARKVGYEAKLGVGFLTVRR